MDPDRFPFVPKSKLRRPPICSKTIEGYKNAFRNDLINRRTQKYTKIIIVKRSG
jgi:hypothetical protein